MSARVAVDVHGTFAAFARWLIARASHLERGPRTTTVLLLLAVLYVTLAAGSLALVPGFAAPW